MDDFVILDIAYSNNNSNVISYMITANHVDSVVWHVRLGHITQDRMNRLARDGLLGQITKINFLLMNIVWRESLLGNFLEKPHMHIFFCS